MENFYWKLLRDNIMICLVYYTPTIFLNIITALFCPSSYW